jgi:hypothetical protein
VILKSAKCEVMFSGPQSGWLPTGPTGAVQPSSEVALLELSIRQTLEGYFLESVSSNPRYSGGDTWHQSYEQAVAQAQHQFGVSPDAWIDVPA